MPTTIAISSFQIPDLNFAGSTFKLRRYYDSDWQDVDGVLHLAGTPGSATDSFDEIDCTLVSHTGTVPSFNATPTLTALINQNVRETWQLWDEAGSARNIIAENWFIPASPATITRGALEIENRGQSLLWPPSWYLNALQVQQLIDAQIGLLNHASSVIEGRTFLDVDPLVAITPEAVGSNSPVIPGFVLHTSKYASLNLAITAITALGGGTIVVDASTPVTSNVATTSSIALRFEGQGILTGAFTVTIAGPLRAEQKPIFHSATTAVFTDNKSIFPYSEKWFGVTGDGVTDDTTAWQKCATAMLSGFTLKLSDNATYKITTTVTFDHLMKFNVVGNGAGTFGLGSIGSVGPSFIWAGADGGGPILTLNNVYNCTFLGFAVAGFASLGAVGAATGIYCTMTAGGTPALSNGCMFTALFIAANSTRADWVGLKIDNASDANNEQHEIRNSVFVGGQHANPLNETGTGIYLGHVNVKHVLISRNAYLFNGKAVDSAGGSYRAEYNAGSGNKIRYSGSVSDAITIIGDEGEFDVQSVVLTGGSVTPISIIGCRFSNLRGGQAASATTTTDSVISVTSCPLTLIGNTFGGQGNFTADFIEDTTGSTSVTWLNNAVNNTDNANMPTAQYLLDAGLNTFASGYASDKFGTRWVGSKNIISNVMTRPTSRALIQSVPNNSLELSGYIPAAVNSLAIGTGEIEVEGLARPNQLTATIVGTAGATSYLLQVLARDSLGNRTLASTLLQSVTTANATLTGSNYIQLDWPAVPNAVDYLVLQYSAGTWRIIDTVTASGTDYETYNIISNPAGAFTYVVPTYNETSTLKLRGATTLSTASPIAFTPTSPAELVANTNNWNPGGTAPFASSIVRFSTDVSRNITGLTFTKPQTAGQCHLLINIGLANAVLKHQDGASGAANRFFCSTAADITLAPKQAADVIYDDINDYWLVYKRN